MIQRFIFLLILLGPAAGALSGVTDDASMSFERVIDPDGRLSCPVYDSVRDQGGFLWLATACGLIRTDGIHYEAFRPETGDSRSLSHSEVRTLLLDRAGRLWAGTERGGLNRFDHEKGFFTRFHPAGRADTTGSGITALHEDRQGRIWAGTSGGEVWRLDRPEAELLPIRKTSKPEGQERRAGIIAIRESGDGTIWIATQGEGLIRFDPQNGAWTSFWGGDGIEPPDDMIVSLEEDGQGGFLVACPTGLRPLRRVDGSWKFLDFNPKAEWGVPESDAIRAFRRMPEGDAWLGTEGGLLIHVAAEKASVRTYRHDPRDAGSFISGRIQHIQKDREGILWIGTSSGLAKYVPGKRKFESLQTRTDGQPEAGIRDVVSIVKDAGGVVWIGYRDGGFSRWNRAAGALEQLRLTGGPDGEFVSCLFCPSPGRLWIGTSAGRWLENETVAGPFSPAEIPSPFVGKGALVRFCPDRRGNVWGGSRGGGVAQFDDQGRLMRVFRHLATDPDSLADDRVIGLETGRGGNVWIALENGLDLLDGETGRIRHILRGGDFDPETRTAEIRAIHVTVDEEIWLGTRRGLFRYRSGDGSFLWLNLAFQVQPRPIQSILGDERDFLWISTEGHGLMRGDRKNFRFAYYSLGSGLHGLDFNPSACFRAEDGEMFFGGYGGLSYFDPENFREALYPPLVAVISVRGRENRPIRENRGAGLRRVSLEKGDFPLTIELASLSFADPTKNQFAWTRSGGSPLNYLATRRILVLPEMPVGRHALRFFGSNSDGIWNMDGIELVIAVRSGLWRRLWPLLVLSGIAALAWLLLGRRRKNEAESLKPETLTDLAPLAVKFSLSPRETDVLRLVLQGKTNKEIETALFISVETVKTHIQRIYKKVKVGSRLQLINRVAEAAAKEKGEPV